MKQHTDRIRNTNMNTNSSCRSEICERVLATVGIVVFGMVMLSSVTFGRVRLSSALFTRVWLSSVIFDTVRLSPLAFSMVGWVRLSSITFGRIRFSSTAFGRVRSSSATFGWVRLSSVTFGRVRVSSRAFGRVRLAPVRFKLRAVSRNPSWSSSAVLAEVIILPWLFSEVVFLIWSSKLFKSASFVFSCSEVICVILNSLSSDSSSTCDEIFKTTPDVLSSGI